MFKLALVFYKKFWNDLKLSLKLLRRASFSEKLIVLISAFVFGFMGKFLFGTFIIDHASLIIFPFFITYWLFNRRGFNRKLGDLSLESRTARVLKSSIYRFELMTFPLTLFLMWIGGIMPYFNWIPPADVYFGIFPEGWLGRNGNDFMWNGFLLAFGDYRIIPFEMLPTYRYLLFNIYAVIYWLSFIPTFMWGVSEGRSLAGLKVHGLHPYVWKRSARVILISVFALIFDAAMALFVRWAAAL